MWSSLTAVSIWRCKAGFVAQDGVQAVQPLVFGERVVLKELGLPAVKSTQTPGGRRDLFHVVLLQQIARGQLLGPFGLKLAVAFGVFAEGWEDDVTGEEAVGGGVAAADGFAAVGGGHGLVPVPLSQANAAVYYVVY